MSDNEHETELATQEQPVEQQPDIEAAPSETVSDDVDVKDDSPVTDKVLWRFNLGCAILHGVQGLLLLIASQTVDSIKDFKKDITIAYQDFDPATQGLVTVSRSVSNVEVGVMAAVFLLLSSVAHAICLVRFKAYIAEINQGINNVRWYEYAISSSVMMIAIAGLFGVFDLATIVLIFLCNASMNLFGLLMEKMNPPNRKKTDWSPFIYGCISGIAPWIAVALYFFGGFGYTESSDNIPGFVYGILISYFIFFQSFPVNMWLQYAKIWKFKDYRYGEAGYMILSLGSKTLLSWLVFGGTFQPNGDSSE